MVKDTSKKGVLKLDPKQFEGEAPIINEEEKNTLTHVYFPTWDNKPKERAPLLMLSDASVLTYQNTSAIIAAPGMGKSSICEAILSASINPNVDNLGWSVSDECQAILYVDNERSEVDVWNSFNRMAKRAQVAYNSEIQQVKIAGMRGIPRLKERLAAIEILLQEREYSILLLDGAGDLVTDTNDLLDAIECRIQLREWTVKYNLSILTTLHPNPNSNKPRGHVGSEICREAECVLLAKKNDDKTRILTTDFEFGKNRNGDEITTGYQWSEEEHMFVSCEVESKEGIKELRAKRKAEAAAEKLSPLVSMRHSELIEHLVETTGESVSTVKRVIVKMLDYQLVEKSSDGLYRKTA